MYQFIRENAKFQFLGITRREKELKKQLTLKDKINLEGNFNTSDKSRNAFMLKGNLAREGYDWWWHSFTGINEKTGEEAPDGSKKHTRLWNGGNGVGRIKLYKKEVIFKDDAAKHVISKKWSLVDDMEVFNAGCEYGVYEE